MFVSGIQGLPLEVTVVSCCNLDDKEWLSRQDPYVSLEYGSAKYRTRTCTDGGKKPTFQEKFIFTLIQALQELNVTVWNCRTLSADEHIGTVRIQLDKVLSQGYDDASWPLHSKTGRHSGEIRLILHYSNSNKQHKAKMDRSQYAVAPGGLSQVLPYNQFPAAAVAHYPDTAVYFIPPPYTGYPYNPAASSYLATPPAGYPPEACPSADYPPQSYPPFHQPQPYYPTGAVGIYLPPPSSSGAYPPPPY